MLLPHRTVLSIVALRTTLETSDVGPRTSSKSGVGAIRFTLDKRCFVIIELSVAEVMFFLIKQVRDDKFKGELIGFDSIESNNDGVIFRRETRSEDNNRKEIREVDTDILQEVCLLQKSPLWTRAANGSYSRC